MKPSLAEDLDLAQLDKLPYPVAAMPKLDGVRGMIKNLNGSTECVGRTHKAHRNASLQALLGHDNYLGMEGELAVKEPTHNLLCNATSGACSSTDSDDQFTLHVFDLWDHPGTFMERHAAAQARVNADYEKHKANGTRPALFMVPYYYCNDAEDVLRFDAMFLKEGFEGTIVRSFNAKHKEGRSSFKNAEYLRIKRFVREEFMVTGIVEGRINNNEATTDLHGRTERSSHKVGMIPSGMVGGLEGYLLKDVYDPHTRRFLMPKGMKILVSPGCMTHVEARHYFLHPQDIVGKISMFNFFPKGMLELPRFPTWQCIRAETDLPEYEDERDTDSCPEPN
jgi:ATP-dependent DNA ligase